MQDDKKEEGIVNDDVWSVIRSYMKTFPLDSVQTLTYDNAIEHAIPAMVENYHFKMEPKNDERKTKKVTMVDTSFTFEFSNLMIHRPSFKETDGRITYPTPQECIERNMTYEGEMTVDIIVKEIQRSTGKIKQEQVYKNTHMGSMPIMVGSKRAWENEKHLSSERGVGGYFIIGGMKKVIVAQERSAPNDISIFQNRKDAPKFRLYTECRSSAPTLSGTSATHSTVCQVGYLSSGVSLSTNKKDEKKRLISVIVPYIPDSNHIPLGILFMALGAKDNVIDILKYIFGSREIDMEFKKFLVPTFEYSYNCDTQEKALLYIGKRGRKYDQEENKRKMHEFEECEDDMHESIESYQKLTQDRKNSFSDKAKKEKIESILYAKNLLTREFLPHLGPNFEKKRYFLGKMVYILVDAAIKRMKNPLVKICSDRDHYNAKRLSCVGPLLTTEFYINFKKMCDEAKTQGEKAFERGSLTHIMNFFRPAIVSAKIRSALSSGKWAKGGASKTGITQNLETLNYITLIAGIRKIRIPISSDGGKIIEPRYLHNSHFGYVDCSDTPEGKNCGLNRYYALTCIPSVGCESTPIEEILRAMRCIIPIEKFEDEDKNGSVYIDLPRVYINNDLIGACKDPSKLVEKIKSMRRSGDIIYECGIVYNKPAPDDANAGDVYIKCDSGRFLRPLFVVKKGNLVLTKTMVKKLRKEKMNFMDLLSQGVVEFLDPSEIECNTILIAERPSDLEEGNPKRMLYTHCELHPSMIFGSSTTVIPYPEKSQAPRNSFQANMGKQAIGVPCLDVFSTASGKHLVLNYVQRPLVMSRASEFIEYQNYPAGQNAVVFVMNRLGYGQEDAIQMCKDSIDRDMFCATIMIGFTGVAKPEKRERFCYPDPAKCNRNRGNNRFLGPDGIIQKRITRVVNGREIVEPVRVEKRDVLIGIVCELSEEEAAKSFHRKQFENCSIVYGEEAPGYVHSIQRGKNGEGYDYIKIMICQDRPPVLGDKFASRYSQKGVISHIYRREDAPFIATGVNAGMTPDLIFNALGMPSRMTLGKFVEVMTARKIASGSQLYHIGLSEFIEKCTKKKGEAFTNLSNEKQRRVYQKFLSQKGQSYYTQSHFEQRFDDIPGSVYGDATPFMNYAIEDIMDELSKLGVNCKCEDKIIDGMTGEELKCLVFNGPIFYQRLKHLSIEKAHSCQISFKSLQLRQPGRDRKKCFKHRNFFL